MILLLCGLSGAGKTTLAKSVKKLLAQQQIPSEIIDGDDYRQHLFKELGFSEDDRIENVRRLAFIAGKLSAHGIVTIISAINPYEHIRQEISFIYPNVKTVHVNCSIDNLICRDTKGLYKRALLADGHPDKLYNLTGVNDRFDVPENPDLCIHTDQSPIEQCTETLFNFIVQNGVCAEKIKS
ncbi:adenylyl-sulfate kinase [Mucilaginibacter sp. dw_454]|uniref:adenylyl-sulfate kinase n=1 Tax=Mucilaginibacter sp. dw_454 TaxID=2720079 RepID=UPI001BD31641|nr:adenylyl-sulfate kinase [Mucilaginibacter sp. dw_454]